MNIAIMFNGKFRWFDSFKRLFEENFKPALEGHKVQYFAHFWNDGGYEKLSEFINTCNPLILSTENQKSAEEVKQILGYQKEIAGNLPNQTYCAYKAFLLLDQYQKHNNMMFDVYVRMRPDIAFLERINFDGFDSESVYFKPCHAGTTLQTFVCDYLYFTKSFESVKKMTDFGFSLDAALGDPRTLQYTQAIYCPEELLAHHLTNKQIPSKLHNFNIGLARDHK